MLDLLIEGDHKKCRKFWAEKRPDMPQPATDEEAEIAMHQARTMAFIPTTLRLWSHRWLEERGLPSMLPPELVSKAMGLEVVDAPTVGISVMALESRLQPACDVIRTAMEGSVKDMLRANNSLPSEDVVRRRLRETYEREADRLFGRVREG